MGSKFILYKTGDTCPCCGQPIKLKNRVDLYAFSLICHLTGLNDVGRTERALAEAEARRKTALDEKRWRRK